MKRPYKNSKIAGDKFDLAVAMYANGSSLEEVAAHFGACSSSILRTFRYCGVPMRSQIEGIRLASLKGKYSRRRGKDKSSWKGGRCKHSNGYILVSVKGHPRADCRGYVPEQVITMEAVIGRHLTKIEVVHHINGDKTDNHIDNLLLFANQSDHMKHHAHLCNGLIGSNYHRFSGRE